MLGSTASSPGFGEIFGLPVRACDDEETVLRPVYGSTGAVTAIRISDERIWDMRFERIH